jgi:hypothetical protein
MAFPLEGSQGAEALPESFPNFMHFGKLLCLSSRLNWKVKAMRNPKE